PAPILMALLLNEVRHSALKRSVQTIVYLPHFVSWVVISGMVVNLLSPAGGLVNQILRAMGRDSVNFIISTRHFRGVLVVSEIWKECGWGTIIYLAAISGIDPSLYEAAIVDGANRRQQVFYITIPSILSTIVVVLILRMGSILSNGFEQIYLLYSPAVYDVADVFETFTYRVGLLEGRFGYSTAVGLFQSAVGLAMIFTTNRIARGLGESGLW
nr:ABC transporter permease subunit [Clostridia bacterium]